MVLILIFDLVVKTVIMRQEHAVLVKTVPLDSSVVYSNDDTTNSDSSKQSSLKNVERLTAYVILGIGIVLTCLLGYVKRRAASENNQNSGVELQTLNPPRDNSSTGHSQSSTIFPPIDQNELDAFYTKYDNNQRIMDFAEQEGFLCPISQTIMNNPFLANDGITYDKSSLDNVQPGQVLSRGIELTHSVQNTDLLNKIKQFIENPENVNTQHRGIVTTTNPASDNGSSNINQADLTEVNIFDV